MGAIFNVKTLQDATGMDAQLAAKWHGPISAAMPLAQINTAERIAMFLAQCGHESGGFKSTEESLNYTPEALQSTFNSAVKIRFTDADAEKYGRTGDHPADQPNIGRLAYGGRMGNDNAGDGYKHRGRGLIQVTGLDNYRAFGEFCWNSPVPIRFMLDQPESLSQPDNAAFSAVWFWKANNLNQWADARDLLTASRVINCGSATTKATPNGMVDRRARYNKALLVMTGRK